MFILILFGSSDVIPQNQTHVAQQTEAGLPANKTGHERINVLFTFEVIGPLV